MRRSPGFGQAARPAFRAAGAAAAVLAVLAVLLGLGGVAAAWAQGTPVEVPASAPAETEASVRILSIQPSPQQPLQPGQRLRLVVEVAYVQPGAAATLALSVQEGPPGRQPLAATLRRVTQPSGVVTLSTELRVPEVTELRVFVPLYLRDGEPTTQVDQRRFLVRPGS